MDFNINSGVWGTMFGVPHIIADNFLKLATADQIKVLLYILRFSGRSVSDEEISRNTGVPIQNIADSVQFWQQVNVLAGQENPPAVQQSIPLTTAQQSVTQTVEIQNAPHQSAPEVPKNNAPRQKQELKPSEISNILNGSPDISELFKIVESLLGNLNHTQQNSLIWMYNYLGLKTEVILTLIQYCINIDKTNSGYIEKIACNWAENEINTFESAQEEVQRLTKFNDFTGLIMKKFEMNRRPTTKQAEFISQWQSEGFSTELIGYAYEKTIEQINKLSFEYINKILLSWKQSGYTTIKNVKDAELDFKRNKNSTQNTSGSSDVDKYKVVINKF